jgi:hypothetical protein
MRASIWPCASSGFVAAVLGGSLGNGFDIDTTKRFNLQLNQVFYPAMKRTA